jgi:hypothetical protein
MYGPGVEPLTARRTWRTLEPLHGMVYFAPEATEEFDRIGLPAPMSYFASRGAALGPAPPELVIATFFNFNPRLVREAIPAAWAVATPAAILTARLAGADRALRRALGDDAVRSAELAEAAELARRAAEAACGHVHGRPLFAAHASLEWPAVDDHHLVLWHAQTLLREFRGDGHVSALLCEGIDGIEALVVHAGTGEVPARALQSTRGWPDDAWAAAVDRLRHRGLLSVGEPLVLSEAGRAQRQFVEDRTDALARVAYGPLGEDDCARLRHLARPFSRMVADQILPVFRTPPTTEPQP